MESTSTAAPGEDRRSKALAEYRKKLLEHRELEEKLKEVRLGLRKLEKDYDKSEEDIKALQSVGQIIGEVLKQLSDDKCKYRNLFL